jgi:methionine-rich copper-binding protein CopC
MPHLRSGGAALLCLLLTALPVGAHSELVDSQPAAGAEMAQPPTEVRLLFTDSLAPNSTVQVLDASFQSVTAAPAVVDAAEPRAMTASLQPLAPGDYTVQYHAVEAADQHGVDGSFAFRVTGAAAGTPATGAAEGSSAPPPSSGGLPDWVYFVTAFLAVIGMFAVTARRRKVSLSDAQLPGDAPEDRP